MTSTDTPGERITSAWVMGILAALTSLGIALAVCVIPVLAAQIAANGSSLTVLGAVLLGLDAFVLGHGGALVLATPLLSGGMSLAPLGLTLLFVLVAASSMRRMGRALDLVEPDGALRAGALADAGRALGAFALVYAVGGGVIAALARSTLVHAITSSGVVACALVALVGGIGGLISALRRPGRGDERPPLRVLSLLPAPFDAVARAAAITLLGLFAGGMLVTLGALLVGYRRAGALFDQLDPGLVGGIVLILLQLALLPTLALWALACVLGGSFTLGVGTSISLGSAQVSVLPALPLLGALPQPGDAPWWALLLLVLPLAAIGIGAFSLVRDVAGEPLRERMIAWGSYVVLVLIATLAVLGLSGGGIGEGRLQRIGPDLSRVALPLLGMLVVMVAVMVLLRDTPAIGWVRTRTERLRSRVEQEEALEATERRGSDEAPERDASRETGAVRAGEKPVPEPRPDGGSADEGVPRSR